MAGEHLHGALLRAQEGLSWSLGSSTGGCRGPQLSCCGWQGPGLAWPGLPGPWGAQAGRPTAQQGAPWQHSRHLGSACFADHSFCSQMIFFIDIGIRKKICLVPSFVFSSGVDFYLACLPFSPSHFFPFAFSSPVSLDAFFLGYLLFPLSKNKCCLSIPCFVTADPPVLLRSSDVLTWSCPDPGWFGHDWALEAPLVGAVGVAFRRAEFS